MAPLPANVSTPLEVDAPSREIAYFAVQTDGSNLAAAYTATATAMPVRTTGITPQAARPSTRTVTFTS